LFCARFERRPRLAELTTPHSQTRNPPRYGYTAADPALTMASGGLTSHRSGYLELYVQSRGALRRELTRHLRTGRALRRPCRAPGQRKNRIPDMVNISARPPEVADRAVPGHCEGDCATWKVARGEWSHRLEAQLMRV